MAAARALREDAPGGESAPAVPGLESLKELWLANLNASSELPNLRGRGRREVARVPGRAPPPAGMGTDLGDPTPLCREEAPPPHWRLAEACPRSRGGAPGALQGRPLPRMPAPPLFSQPQSAWPAPRISYQFAPHILPAVSEAVCASQV